MPNLSKEEDKVRRGKIAVKPGSVLTMPQGKPECTRCIKSKRPCEGYSIKTVFRNENPMHYQQNIRPSPASSQQMHDLSHEHIQFSVPQYHSQGMSNGKSFRIVDPANGIPQYANIQPNMKPPVGDPASRNSSASNASGVSANSEQRRISVLSLMSPVNEGTPAHTGERSSVSSSTYRSHRTPETDARDN